MYKCNIVLIFSITFCQLSLHLKAGGDELCQQVFIKGTITFPCIIDQ